MMAEEMVVGGKDEVKVTKKCKRLFLSWRLGVLRMKILNDDAGGVELVMMVMLIMCSMC